MARNPSADDLIEFLNSSPSPYHAVSTTASRLVKAGVPSFNEEDALLLRPGASAHIIRGGGSLIAIRVPSGFSSDNPLPFHIAAAHTDSPCLKLKPRPAESSHQYLQWGVEVYGGVLNNSWLDRDLGIAGRFCRMESGRMKETRVKLDEHPVRIPQLAIHLDRTVNEQGLVLNAQKHLTPLLGQTGGNSSLESILETEAGAPFKELTFDLCLYDRTPACYGGLGDEFIYSARLDNLAMCHAALSAFLLAPEGDVVQVLALFDHEEVGSVSAHGAGSNLLASLLERVASALGVSREKWLGILPRSFLVSADMAHGIHPNYPDKHEPDHFPLLNGGVVLKNNAGLRYASDAVTAARFQEWVRRAGAESQHFLNRADLGCGTTLGPGLSAQLGIPAVDAGTAMLSMHSVREMCGADDQGVMIGVLKEFFRGK